MSVLIRMHFRFCVYCILFDPFNLVQQKPEKFENIQENLSKDCTCYAEFCEQIYFEIMIKGYSLHKFQPCGVSILSELYFCEYLFFQMYDAFFFSVFIPSVFLATIHLQFFYWIYTMKYIVILSDWNNFWKLFVLNVGKSIFWCNGG